MGALTHALRHLSDRPRNEAAAAPRIRLDRHDHAVLKRLKKHARSEDARRKAQVRSGLRFFFFFLLMFFLFLTLLSFILPRRSCALRA
jgi:hypothetical protein